MEWKELLGKGALHSSLGKLTGECFVNLYNETILTVEQLTI